jgi:hypothetical protein
VMRLFYDTLKEPLVPHDPMASSIYRRKNAFHRTSYIFTIPA